MGRNRTPTAVLELRGAFKNHPSRGRERTGEVKSTKPLGDAPAGFSKSQKAIWKEFVEVAFWLTSPDRFMCEVAITLIDKHRRNQIDIKEIPQLISALAKLGFGPADRAKMKVPVAEPIDDSMATFK